MRSGLVALFAVALGCSSNDFDLVASDAETDSGTAIDSQAPTDTAAPPPDTATPPPDTSTEPRDTSIGVDASPGTCARNSECTTNHYCSYTGCATIGVCKPFSPMPGPYFDPVCGCDGTTFWNAQHAWANSAAIKHDGACTTAERKTCTVVGEKCDLPDSLCVVQWPAFASCTLSPASGGGCWRLPPSPSCAMGGGAPMLPCVGSTCMSHCNAVLSKKAFYGASCVP